MATTVARLEAVLSAQTRDFDRAMTRSQTRIKRVGTAAGIAGAAIFAGLGVVAKRGFTEISDSQKVMAQTAAGIKSTGGAANVTAKGVANLSARLSEMSGIDDEVIQQSANLLLTFRKVHNEAGRGNRIFDRATQAALDLSVRGFGSMDSTAKMLGKALEDPVRGMTALRRAGVTFTDAQKETIKSLIESGDLLGAQKLILGEVEKQVGGSAKAYGNTLPGQMAKARNAFDEVAATLTKELLPVVTSVLQKFVGLIGFLEKHPKAAKAMAIALGVLATALIAVRIATLAASLAFYASPFGLVTLAILALVAGIVLLIKNWDKVKEKMLAVWGAIKGAVMGALDWVKDHWPEIATVLSGPFAPLVLLATDAFGVRSALEGAISGVINWIKDKFTAIYTVGKDFGVKLKDGAVAGVLGIANKVWGVIDNIGAKFVEMAQTIIGWGTTLGTHIKNAVVNAIVGVGEGIWGKLLIAWENLKGNAETVIGWGTSIGGWIKTNVIEAIVGVGSGIWEKLKAGWENLKENAKTIIGWGKQIGEWIKDAIVASFKGLAGEIWDAIKGIPGAIGEKFKDGDAGGKVPAGPRGPVGGNMDLHGALPVMQPFAQAAAGYGLAITAGKDDHAKYTRSGKISDHWYGKALDVSNGVNTPQMAGFFRSLIGNPRVKQAFYDPLGSIFGGILSSYREGGHSDHVHVATYDRGGFLRPGWNLAYNGTGAPERVGGGGNITFNFPNYVGSRQDLMAAMQNMAQEFKRRNGKSPF